MSQRVAPVWARGEGVLRLEEVESQKLAEDAAQERLQSRGIERLPFDVARAAAEMSDEERARRRVSPRRNRWREVAELDARVARLERRQADLSAELLAAHEQFERAKEADKAALAAWVENQSGDRPLPNASGLEQRIVDLRSEYDALTTAVSGVLAESPRWSSAIEGGSSKTLRGLGAALSSDYGRRSVSSRKPAQRLPTTLPRNGGRVSIPAKTRAPPACG
jgi:chromosome segregation ATPase